MSTLDDTLRDYLDALTKLGSPVPRVIERLDPNFDWASIELPEGVKPFDDLKSYFARINGYTDAAIDETGSSTPILAWSMHALSLEQAIEHDDSGAVTRNDETPDYWPAGFLPILWDCSGSYIVVNCIDGSPTYGAVYAMDEGVGCTQVAGSLSKFFESCTRELNSGFMECWEGDIQVIREKRDQWARAQASFYGNSPYFKRKRMDEQIVDWKSRGFALDLLSRMGKRFGESKTKELSHDPQARVSKDISPDQAAIRRWALSVGWVEPLESDTLAIQLSTAPVAHWYFNKSKLSPETVSIRALIHHDRWWVQLERLDRLFVVQWRSDNSISIDSNQMKYQRLIRWPELKSLEELPTFVNNVAKVLGIQFIRYADVGPHTRETEAMRKDPRLMEWLRPCADKIGCYIGES